MQKPTNCKRQRKQPLRFPTLFSASSSAEKHTQKGKKTEKKEKRGQRFEEMYAELDLLFSYSQGFSFSPEVQSFCSFQRPSSMNYPVQTTVSEYDLGGEGDLFKAPQPVLEEPVGLEPMTLISMIPDDQRITRQTIKTSTLSEYDVGGDGDLFKAPEPITEEPMLGYDPMAAISMTSCGEDAITAPMIKAANIESFQGEQLFDEVFYECKKDLVAKSVIDDSLSEVLDVKNPAIRIEEDLTVERGGFITGGLMQKSFSSGSLSSMEWTTGRATRPSFLDFPATDFGAALGMRRAFSEGDMQILATGNVPGRSPISQLLNTGSYTPEERKLRLSRYRIKKAKRNFGRKIKYACRKALADSQPRVRGRFAKTEEVWDSNYSKQDGCKYSTARQVEGSSQTSSYGTVGEITRIENPFERLHGSISGSCHYQELAAIGPYFLQR